jgi:protein phosphatase
MTNPALAGDAAYPVAMGSYGAVAAAGMTNVGLSRPGNEDSFLIATLERSLTVHATSNAARNARPTDNVSGTLLMVADGMGGEGGGDVASRVAVDAVASYLLNALPWADSATVEPPSPASTGVRAQLSIALVVGDASVKVAAGGSATPHMGTTLTMALVLWPWLYVAHAGDTRCYFVREGQLSRLTTDHTMAQRIHDEGAEAVDPASALHHVLWNSLGGSPRLPEPQLVKLELRAGDRLLLCTDGLTNHVSDQQILTVLGAGEPNATQCSRLIELANAGGGSDNVTVLIASAREAAASSGHDNGVASA